MKSQCGFYYADSQWLAVERVFNLRLQKTKSWKFETLGCKVIKALWLYQVIQASLFLDYITIIIISLYL